MIEKQKILQKTVEIEKIIKNISDSKRINEGFEIIKTNRKLRKTMQYFKNYKKNNYLDSTILLQEMRTEKGYYFLCLEGAARIVGMKHYKRIRFLKCRVNGALKGVNEIKRINDDYIEIRKRGTTVIRFDDCPVEIKEQYSKKPIMTRTRVPIMGKRV